MDDEAAVALAFLFGASLSGVPSGQASKSFRASGSSPLAILSLLDLPVAVGFLHSFLKPPCAEVALCEYLPHFLQYYSPW